MWDEHLTGQHRLHYYVRGPEWAFAIPDGDLDVLEEVMSRCSTFWNGGGSLLIPVTADGRVRNPRVVDALLHSRPVDACYVHQSLSDAAQASVQARVPGAVRMWHSFDDHQVHVLNLRDASQPAIVPRLEVPVFNTATMRRVLTAVWGAIPDPDLLYWRRRFEWVERNGDDAYGALLRGQLDGAGAGPLRLSARQMQRISTAQIDWPYIWIFAARPSFRELVNFWNFRARLLPVFAGGAPVLGIPRQALARPQQLHWLTTWLRRVPGVRRNPDVFVASSERAAGEVREALGQVPLIEDTAPKHNEQIGSGITPNEPATYAFARPMLGDPFIRGVQATALAAFANGRCSLALPAPEGFDVRGFGRTRMAFSNLPLPLPVSHSVARHVHRDAEARDGGVMLHTDARSRWDFDVRLPTAAEALEYWVADHGYGLSRSRDGRDAEAVLQRLGALDELDALAHTQRFALLRLLAPDSHKKLAQRLVGEASRAGAQLTEDEMVERLADIGLFLEVQARTAGDIASEMRKPRPDVFELLSPLVAAGFIQRGYRIKCPRCRFWQLLDLSAQDEHVRCRACGETYLLPVVDESGEREPERYYRLDGLMARALDQDVLPMLLTLRALRPPPEQGTHFYHWAGVEFDPRDGTAPIEVDLLVSDGRTVWCWETKQNARTLKAPQLRRRLELAAALGARPGIAGVEGEFPVELAKRVEEAGGRVLTSDELLK